MTDTHILSIWLLDDGSEPAIQARYLLGRLLSKPPAFRPIKTKHVHILSFVEEHTSSITSFLSCKTSSSSSSSDFLDEILARPRRVINDARSTLHRLAPDIEITEEPAIVQSVYKAVLSRLTAAAAMSPTLSHTLKLPKPHLPTFHLPVPNLLVCGSRGLNPLKGLILGSTSHHLLEHLIVPVLLVHPTAPSPHPTPSPPLPQTTHTHTPTHRQTEPPTPTPTHTHTHTVYESGPRGAAPRPAPPLPLLPPTNTHTPHDAAQTHDGPLRILLAVDDSTGSRAATEAVRDLTPQGAEVIVCAAYYGVPAPWTHLREAAHGAVVSAAKRLRGGRAGTDTPQAQEDPPPQAEGRALRIHVRGVLVKTEHIRGGLTEAALREGATVVAVGAQSEGIGILKGLALGSVAQHMATRPEIPAVLVVPAHYEGTQ